MLLLQYAIKVWGHRIPAEEVEAIMTAADVDGDGMIDYHEFVAATMNISQLEKEDLIWRAFNEFDTDGSGWISFAELERVRPHRCWPCCETSRCGIAAMPSCTVGEAPG